MNQLMAALLKFLVALQLFGLNLRQPDEVIKLLPQSLHLVILGLIRIHDVAEPADKRLSADRHSPEWMSA